VTEYNRSPIAFSSLGKRKVVADFAGGTITSDGCVLLLRQIERRVRLIERMDAALPDPRNQSLITHSQVSMLRQRVFAIALGQEDLNDHQTLRVDPLLQLACERMVAQDQPLASPPTLCRLENRAMRRPLVEAAKVLVEVFIESHQTPPKELILDFDATNDSVHGHQVGRFFHGYYDEYCFLPLYVFAGSQRLVACLRPADQDGATHAWAILVTNLTEEPRPLYEQTYCQRGEAENRIKEQQLGLFADRTSCHDFEANQLRVLLSAAAYVLIEHLRRTELAGTELEKARVTTLRLKLLKIGGRVLVSARRIVLHLASSFPLQDLFRRLAASLVVPLTVT
jgi:hypothetical protein